MKSTYKDKLSYGPEADVLSWEISDGDKDIDYAKEWGDLIVHFSKNNRPVLIEILNARKFLKKMEKLAIQR